MQHETAYPATLGFDEYDVSNSYCEYVVEHATRWLRNSPQSPFLLTAGFFETHRPFPRERYAPSDANSVDVPGYLPDTPEVRDDLAEFYGSITVADAKVGELLEVLTETGLDQNTWVVFMTDHGPALPRAKSTLYDAGTGIALIVRPPRGRTTEPLRYDELFSGSICCPPFGTSRVEIPEEVQGVSHAGNIQKQSGELEEVRLRYLPPKLITIPSILFELSGQRITAI